MKRFATILCASSCFVIGTSLASQVFSQSINTADKSGAYHRTFCPPLKKALKKAQFKYNCTPTLGSRDNIEKVSSNAASIGYAQLDLYALEMTMQGGKKLLHTLRDDIARECLFMVTNNPKLQTFGQVASQSENLRFILPPKKSGHVGTFQFLQQIDPKGMGLAKDVSYAGSTEAALQDVLNSVDEKSVTMFVQFPDPGNPRFKQIAKKGGHFVPVIDRKILRQDIGGEKVYFAEDTQISNPNWNKKGQRLITACTPIVLFTGVSQQIENETDRKDHEDLIKTIEALPLADLQPKKDFLSQLWNKTKTLSATSVEAMLKASDKARVAAEPMVDKAIELKDKAVDASKPALEKAKELGGQAIEKAGELVDKARKDTSEFLDNSQ